MQKKQKQANDDCFNDDETARRRDKVVRFMANTPASKATSPHRSKKKKTAGADRAVRKARAGGET
jgi:hypothetical protein